MSLTRYHMVQSWSTIFATINLKMVDRWLLTQVTDFWLLSTGNRKCHPINEMLNASNVAAMWQSRLTTVQLQCNCYLYKWKQKTQNICTIKLYCDGHSNIPTICTIVFTKYTKLLMCEDTVHSQYLGYWSFMLTHFTSTVSISCDLFQHTVTRQKADKFTTHTLLLLQRAPSAPSGSVLGYSNIHDSSNDNCPHPLTVA